MTTPLFLRCLLVLWCEIWNDKLHIFYFISSTVKKSVPFFVIAALDKSSFYMTDTHRIIFPTHVNPMVMWGFTSHLNPTCVSSVDPPALKKQPPDPANSLCGFAPFLSQLGQSQKLPPITMTFLKFRFYPERQIGVKRRTWLWNASNSAGMLPECKSPAPACSITPSVTFSFKCRAKSKDRLAMRRVELCTLQKMDK